MGKGMDTTVTYSIVPEGLRKTTRNIGKDMLPKLKSKTQNFLNMKHTC
jgi:hypothetical protein